MPELMVTKSDGSLEPIDYNKVREALRRAGASRTLCDEVVESLQSKVYPNILSSKIYQLAFSELRDLRPGAAARFALKSALMKLGPDGYPFETFVGALLKGRGYYTELRQILQGRCVSHEIDVVATRPAIPNHSPTKAIVECKFHNAPYMRCHIQSALYSWARFEDIHANEASIDSVWLATNTKFSSDTIAYADCIGLKLLGWGFPADESIQVRIEENKLYPITILPNLNRRTFEILHAANLILVKDVLVTPDEKLQRMGLPANVVESLKEQGKQVMSARG